MEATGDLNVGPRGRMTGLLALSQPQICASGVEAEGWHSRENSANTEHVSCAVVCMALWGMQICLRNT